MPECQFYCRPHRTTWPSATMATVADNNMRGPSRTPDVGRGHVQETVASVRPKQPSTESTVIVMKDELVQFLKANSITDQVMNVLSQNGYINLFK